MLGTALVVGGGFYGCYIATLLRRRFAQVTLIERDPELLTRASRVNQARLHHGYHYPRSYLTAARSRANLEVFCRQFPDSVHDECQHLYCIGRHDSKVGRAHFERFCRMVGLPLEPAPAHLRRMFSDSRIEAVYEAREPAFDVDALRVAMKKQLAAAEVHIRTGTSVERIAGFGSSVGVALTGGEVVVADWIFNCTYSAINRLVASEPSRRPKLRHQFTEVALMAPPEELRGFAVTVMDGPFFSMMPFPAEKLHSLTHVRYTPHASWSDMELPGNDPDAVFENFERETRFPWMVRDAARYLPAIAGAKYVKSLYEIKTLLAGSEVDDSRPILTHRDGPRGRIVSIMGAKIDNIFDIHESLEEMLLSS